MSRVALGLKNTKVSFTFYLALLALTFFSRKIFIDSLGVDVMGLNSAITNILNIMNLSELGVGTAIATSLYQPLFDKSTSKISDILSILGYFYRLIGYVVIAIGVILLICIPFLFDGETVSMPWVYIAFGSFFIVNLVPYFISYQQAILTADQRHYEISSATNILVAIKVVIQIVLLKVFGFDYISWLIMEILFAFILGLWLVFRVKKVYPWLNVSYIRGKQCRQNYPEIFKKSRQIIPHRISGAVLMQTDNILLLILASLETVTYYTNYSMLMTKAVDLVAATSQGLLAGVGNLIAEGNMDSVKKLFWEFNALFLLISSIVAIGLYYISSNFIVLWLGSEFVLGDYVVLAFSLNSFLLIMRIPLVFFTNGYALFKDIWAPICEMILNLVISYFLGLKFGILGILLGTVVSLTFIQIWKPYFFYREIFKESVFGYWKEISKYIFVIALSWGVIHYIFRYTDFNFDMTTFVGLILNSILITIVCLVMIIGVLYHISNGMKDVTDRVLLIIFKRS